MLFRLSNVTKSYGGTDVLKSVSFQVNPKERVGLVGRNGAGKTTIFRMITGQESPDEGEVVRMNGIRLGLLEQHVDLGNAKTVHEAALSAFEGIHEIEAEMRRLEHEMATDHSPEILARYADLQADFEHADGFTYAARAESVLLGMGFPREMWEQDAHKLSGGQRNRLGMVRLLLSGADVLLMDEPTNHLDVNAVEWLEDFLREYDGSFVVISHDRYFLDRVANRVVEIDRGQAFLYKGNYTQYLAERELRRDQMIREYKNQQAFINKTQEFIRRNLEGQKTKQAKSRRTLLARMERIDSVAEEKPAGNFGLRKVEVTGNNVLTTEELSIGYKERTIASGLSLAIHRGDTLGIIGGNGTGKTTFLRTLLGELSSLGGTVMWGTKVNIGYYSQNLEGLSPRNEVIAELRLVAPLVDNGTLRSFLAKFLFFGDDVFKPVSALSGGEKGRLALAKLIYSQKNVLVLDEPTNHLDIPSRESLEDALDEYDGTIIVVSHDRFFLDKIANRTLSFEPDGEVFVFNGNYTEFHDWKASRAAELQRRKDPETTVSSAEPAARESAVSGTKTSSTDPLSKNQRNQLEKRIKEIEAEIPVLETDAAGLIAEMSRPDVAADFAKLSEINGKLESKQASIRRLYAEWDDSAAKLG